MGRSSSGMAAIALELAGVNRRTADTEQQKTRNQPEDPQRRRRGTGEHQAQRDRDETRDDEATDAIVSARRPVVIDSSGEPMPVTATTSPAAAAVTPTPASRYATSDTIVARTANWIANRATRLPVSPRSRR